MPWKWIKNKVVWSRTLQGKEAEKPFKWKWIKNKVVWSSRHNDDDEQRVIEWKWIKNKVVWSSSQLRTKSGTRRHVEMDKK